MSTPTISDTPLDERSRTETLSTDALEFLGELHGRFDARRRELLAARAERRARIAAGGGLDFLPETREIREDPTWQVIAPRADYLDRRVEITGPTDRKLVIDALNSGAKGFMADFEVAHPDVVGVATAAFDAILGDRPNQIDRRRDDVVPDAAVLADLGATPGEVTEAGLRSNVGIGFRYISFWLGGRGAVGLDNMMEDAATAEISRSQIWQWIHNGTTLEDGTVIDRELVSRILDEELERIRAEVGEETWEAGRPEDTRRIFEAVALGDDFPDFLTEMAYELLD
jgi:malate synthase